MLAGRKYLSSIPSNKITDLQVLISCSSASTYTAGASGHVTWYWSYINMNNNVDKTLILVVSQYVLTVQSDCSIRDE